MTTDLQALTQMAKKLRDPKADFSKDNLELVRVQFHPDRYPPDLRDLATEVVQLAASRLSAFDKPKPSAAVLGKFVVTEGICHGDICKVYRAEKADVPGRTYIVKVAADRADNDLMDRELQALKTLTASKQDVKYQKYIPRFNDSFKAGGLRVNVIDEVPSAYPLTQLFDVAKINDFRHLVWMFNRLLTALGFIHREGMVHGAVTPDHLLYVPEEHGLVLVDYTAATVMAEGNKIPYKSDRWEHLYPPEVDRKLFGEPTDIYMAARCIEYAIDIATNGKVPANEFNHVLDYCQLASPYSRPQDAWEVQQMWKAAAERVYGKPKFVPVEMVTV